MGEHKVRPVLGCRTCPSSLTAHVTVFLLSRKQKLITVSYKPTSSGKAIIVWHHGLREHTGRMKKGACVPPQQRFADCVALVYPAVLHAVC